MEDLDGTKVYIMGRNNDRIYAYNLSTPWDVSSGGYTGENFSVTSQEAVPHGLFFNPDGTKLYVIGTNSDRIFAYDLSTPWDVSSGGYTGENFSVASQATAPTNLFFKPDGMKVFIVSSRIYAYNLSTPWDVSSASYGSENYSFPGLESNPRAVFFKPDGTQMYIMGTSGDRVYSLDLSSAWSISSVFYGGDSLLVNSQESLPHGLFFKPDGTRLYVVGTSSDRIFAYDLSTPWDVTTGSYASESLSVSSQTGEPTSVFFGIVPAENTFTPKIMMM